MLTAIIFTGFCSGFIVAIFEFYFIKSFYYCAHMFILKKKYYLIIENIKDINLKNIKKRNKFVIIYRNNKNIDKEENLLKFRKICKLKSIKFFVANNINLAVKLSSDGIYLSSYNKSLKPLSQKKVILK